MTKKPTLADLSLDALEVHPDNVRRDLGDRRALVRSIKEVGVVVPLIVVPNGSGKHTIIAGERRYWSAIDAEQDKVPCIVRHDLEGQTEQIAAMIIENVHRQPLSTGEEAAAYEQLAGLGLSDTKIAKATGMSRKHVAKARKVAASEVAKAAADRHNLTLDQALALAEFEDDADAVNALTVTARQDPARFAHVASRLRQDRDRAAQVAAAVEALAEQGYTVMERASEHSGAVALRDLTDSDDGAPIAPEDHAECPGRAAVVDDWDPEHPRHFCLDPDGNGHRSRHNRTTTPERTPMSDEAKAERREVVENNKAWRAAEPVRREYVTALLGRKKAPSGTLRFVTEAIVGDPERVGDGKEHLVAELLGVEAPSSYGRSLGPSEAARSADARLPLVLLAQVAADSEQHMGVHTWRRRDPRAARYLSFLASTGYGLSEIEQRVVDDAADDSADEVEDEAA